MPVLRKVRQQAQTVKCAANLHTIGHALTMYTQQYGYYPSGFVNEGVNLYAIWPVRLRNMLGGEQGVFYCPAQDERCEWKKGEPHAGAPGRAAEAHARFGYEVGEPLLERETA